MEKSIVQWCKEQADQGNKLALKWDGGGDSGWAHFEIDGEDVENEYTEALVNRIYDVLDYGSWAGEFSASGEAVYDPETNSFEGVDYYGEDAHDTLEDIDLKIHVPKKLWFDTLHIEVEANYDDGPEMSVRLLIKNGFLTDEHREFCSNLENSLAVEFATIFENFESTEHYQFRGCTDSWILERADAIDGQEDLIFKITRVDIQTIDGHEKSIVLELDEETAAAIDEQLNDE
jgi:hypothetical protein